MPDEKPPPTRGRVFQETQRVVLDLREPPTREEAGLEPGRSALIVEREPGGMLDVSFTLPNGEVLAVPAIGVVLSTSSTAPADGPVESITVNRAADDLDEARAALIDGAKALGIDTAEVERYFAGVVPGSRVGYVFRGPRVGYLHAEVEVRHDPAHGPDAEVDYTLDWGSMLGPRTAAPGSG